MEREVQAAWYVEELRGVAKTAGGDVVKVLDPGEWNFEAGPDFIGAKIEIAGNIIYGDVEVHEKPGDWKAHGHGGDVAYAGVVAHVCRERGKAEGLPSGCVEVFIEEMRRGFDASVYPEARWRGIDREIAERVVRKAGQRRIEMKAARFSALGLTQSVFYEEIFSALGYKYNAFPFRDVARAMPWEDFPKEEASAIACLQCVAGLSVTEQSAWRRTNVRPQNDPIKRLAAAACLFREGPGLMQRLLSLNYSSRTGQLTARKILTANHIMGRGRAGAVIANVLVPFSIAMNGTGIPNWICPEDVSAPVRSAALKLFGRDHSPSIYATNGLMIQGLIQLFKESRGAKSHVSA